MRVVFVLPFLLGATTHAAADCDQVAGAIIGHYVRGQIENFDCGLLKKAGLDEKAHHFNGVCYSSTGGTSHIRIDGSLQCKGSSEGVVSKATGRQPSIPPGDPENVTVEADASGPDCRVSNVVVKPSGEIGKLLAAAFDVNGKARQALQSGLTKACGR